MPPQTNRPPYASSAPSAQNELQRILVPALWVLTMAGLGFVLYMCITAVQLRQATGVLHIETTDTQAVTTLSQAGTASIELGTGPQSTRLRPGTYQVSTTGNTGGISKQVVIEKQKDQTVRANLASTVPLRTIANFSAQSLYATDTDLYFLNVREDMPYVYSLQTRAGRPYLSNITNNAALHWISPTQVISESPTGGWTYINNGTPTTLAFDDHHTPQTNVSINQAGRVAFLTTDQTVAVKASPDNPATILSENTVSNEEDEVSVAPNGTIAVYTPYTSLSPVADALTLYDTDGLVISTDQALGLASNLAWNSASSRFSYATNKGLFVYDVAQKTKRHILRNAPTDPNSTFWISDTKLLYAQSNTVWVYDMTRGEARKLLHYDGDLGATDQQFIMAKNGTIYFSTTADTEGRGGSLYSFNPGFNELSKEAKADEQAVQQESAEQTLSFSGLDTLGAQGVASRQVAALEFALRSFAGQQYADAKRMTVRNIKYDAGNTSQFTFDLRVDNEQQFSAQLLTIGLTRIELTLTDVRTNQVVYSSGRLSGL